MKKLLLCLAVAVSGLTLFASTNTAEAHGGPGYRYRGGYPGPVGYRNNYWGAYRGNFYRGGSCGYTPNYGYYGNSWYGSGLYLSTPNFGFSTYGW